MCTVKPTAGALIVRILVKPEPLSYESTIWVGPFAGVGLDT